jgi:cytochrome c oxidase subunit 3
MLVRTIIYINTKNIVPAIFRTTILPIIITNWWRDVSRERSFQGFHPLKVIEGLHFGILLFITSEVLFFFSFFWIFFHRSLAPNLELGARWPPAGIQAINPFQIPLLNTLVLLSRGISVTWAHHALLQRKNNTTYYALILTVVLGGYFTLLQGWEYWDTSYSFADSIFGSCFFIATGFHGLHVIVGTLFLLISLKRLQINTISNKHHVGLEIAIWYWHFVDVVWLFLYTFIYWWSY